MQYCFEVGPQKGMQMCMFTQCLVMCVVKQTIILQIFIHSYGVIP